jgi:membrane-bound ClpP family serine protease
MGLFIESIVGLMVSLVLGMVALLVGGILLFTAVTVIGSLMIAALSLVLPLIAPLLFLGLVVWLVIYFAKRSSSSESRQSHMPIADASSVSAQ